MRLAELFPTVERAFANWADAQIEGTEMSPARVRLLGVLRCKGAQMMSGLGGILGVTARNVATLVDGVSEKVSGPFSAYQTGEKKRKRGSGFVFGKSIFRKSAAQVQEGRGQPGLRGPACGNITNAGVLSQILSEKVGWVDQTCIAHRSPQLSRS